MTEKKYKYERFSVHLRKEYKDKIQLLRQNVFPIKGEASLVEHAIDVLINQFNLKK
ncbi:MAG: hypothetical protein LBQ24_00490 [Candidatus Peribacteria bacterium]|jgi:hypothetical protein|nr:hypothetical protein [Candidatus Peribacteria bacterium]